MIYREFQPPPALEPVVERLWCLEGAAGDVEAGPIPPDGHAEIVVHAGDPFVEVRADGTTHVQDRVLLVGQMTRAVRLTPSGFTRAIGARLRPDGAYRLFGAPQDGLTNHIVDLRDLHRGFARTIAGDVTGRESVDEMARAFQRALRSFVPGYGERSPVELAVDHAHRGHGLVRVPALARLAGVGTRQLERLFSERVGLTPKNYLRIIRFQEALRSLRGPAPAPTWADLAVAHGYYDQAHFIRDFKTFVGLAPTAWQITNDSLTTLFSALGRSGDARGLRQSAHG